MKRFLMCMTALAVAATVQAKSLSNTSGLAPTTDSVYSAVTKINNELGVIYTYINTLFKMQAQSTAPSGNATYDLWEDTSTTPPTLKYYDGDSWESLSSAAFSSGLTLESSAKGVMTHAYLVRENATSTRLMVPAYSHMPAIVEIGDKVLQNTSAVYLDFSGVAAGQYWVHAVRSGATTNFTLAYDASPTNVPYIGTVILSATSTIARVVAYESYRIQTGLMPLEYFHVAQTGALAIGAAYVMFPFNTEIYDLDGRVSSGVFTCARAGWYELHGNMQASHITPAETTMSCITFLKGPTLVGENCSMAGYVSNTAIVNLAVGDTITMHGVVSPGGGDLQIVSGRTWTNAMWGRWIGVDY
jgi:hypothetical protein